MRSIGGWKTISTRVKLIAVVAVLLMVFSSFVYFVGSEESQAATNTDDTAYATKVVYEPGSPTLSGTYNDTSTPVNREETYSGNVISTEYNPQVWDFGTKWYGINSYVVGSTAVFTGWQYGYKDYDSTSKTLSDTVTWFDTGTTVRDPGDVLRYESKAWYIGNTSTKLCDDEDEIHIRATWGTVNNVKYNQQSYSNSSGTEYTNFNLISSNTTISRGSNCTIRENDIENSAPKVSHQVTLTSVSFSGNVIIDNVKAYFWDGKMNHADQGSGVFANGNTLILGDGINTVFNTSYSSGSGDSYYLGSVYGGTSSGTVYGSTKVIVHSGILSNIVAGGGNVTRDTYLVVNGATVTDSLLGGSHRNYSYQTIYGNAWVFATGLNMVGDYYEEHCLDSNYTGIYDTDKKTAVKAYESSVLTGGCNDGTIKGDTHVYLSGDSSVWDVQAGGRRAASAVQGTASIEVSGKAIVKHTLCGSITDGSSDYDYQSVKKVSLSVRGEAEVANVFGAGFDTFYVAEKTSMYGAGTQISINITGGTVGYVYGGGYRGTIGTSTNPIDWIKIQISGGTILGDVFGGGRGGVDKTCHDTNGYNSWSTSHKDYTGHSEVYAKSVMVSVTGGEVRGSVYGGGESVAWMSGYTDTYSGTSYDINNRKNVATVHISTDSTVENNGVYVSISGTATVSGSVYGAGKGIDTTQTYVPYIYSIKNKSVVKIPWLAGNDETGETSYTDTSSAALSVYETYARVYGNITVTVGNANEAALVGENVYGGGALGYVGESGSAYSVKVSIIEGSTVTGSVYGAGKGTSTSDSLGQVNGHTSVTVGGTVLGNIYGGGAYGQLTGYTSVSVAGTVGINGSESNGNVYGGGQGLDSSLTLGKVGGNAVVEISGTAKGNVYGGGAYGQVTGSTEVTVTGTVGTEGGSYGNVYGGGQGLATSDSLGKVGVNSEVTITGTALGNVYGGGAYGIVDGSTTVTVSGKVGTEGSDYGNVYGGGQGVASGSDSKIGQVDSVTEVSIKSGATIYNSVYGGGAHGNVTSSDKTIPVTIESGATVYKNVFGGGYGDSTKYTADDGYVAGSTVVSVAGTVKGNVYGGGGYGVVEGATSVSVTGTVDGTVYGGGFGFAGEKSNQGATVTIISGKVGSNVYGGARNGKSEGNTSVTITPATVGGTVYGGGLGVVDVTSVTGTSSVTVTSSNISGSVYGAAKNGIVGTEGATVDQTSSVVLDSTKVGENVFGGGVGELGKVSVYGKTSVEVKGTTEIGGSVYGAAKNGYVTSSQVTITSGTVKGDVYGAGLGAVSGGNIQVSVTGDVAVTMSGGTVEGLFYGGAAYGQV